jgi:CheY-like chemotaxis protein
MAKILLIDDDKDLTLITSMLLKQKGYDVVVANDGREGIDQAGAVSPDLVLCDLRLQGELDGLQVVKELRSQPATKGLKIYALTGFSGDEIEEKALLAGFDGVITKADDCLELVETVIQRM